MSVDVSANGLPVLVVTEETVSVPTKTPSEPGEYVEQGQVKEFLRRVVRREPVDLDTVKGELAKVEEQVEMLLKEREDRAVGGMNLHGVEVSLGVTAEGTIGLVSAGVEVSLTLVYQKK